tara:strand:- start:4793 stop:4963 length:171 start_codon:yes stop_codon:yes gene_type:complete
MINTSNISKMLATLDPVQQLFFGISFIGVLMFATVAYMVNSDGYENYDRLKKFFKK